MVTTTEELKKILNDFWLLDLDDYENLENMISQEIYEIDQILLERPDDPDEKEARNESILLREKIIYIISNGLYKK